MENNQKIDYKRKIRKIQMAIFLIMIIIVAQSIMIFNIVDFSDLTINISTLKVKSLNILDQYDRKRYSIQVDNSTDNILSTFLDAGGNNRIQLGINETQNGSLIFFDEYENPLSIQETKKIKDNDLQETISEMRFSMLNKHGNPRIIFSVDEKGKSGMWQFDDKSVRRFGMGIGVNSTSYIEAYDINGKDKLELICHSNGHYTYKRAMTIGEIASKSADDTKDVILMKNALEYNMDKMQNQNSTSKHVGF